MKPMVLLMITILFAANFLSAQTTAISLMANFTSSIFVKVKTSNISKNTLSMITSEKLETFLFIKESHIQDYKCRMIFFDNKKNYEIKDIFYTGRFTEYKNTLQEEESGVFERKLWFSVKPKHFYGIYLTFNLTSTPSVSSEKSQKDVAILSCRVAPKTKKADQIIQKAKFRFSCFDEDDKQLTRNMVSYYYYGARFIEGTEVITLGQRIIKVDKQQARSAFASCFADFGDKTRTIKAWGSDNAPTIPIVINFDDEE